MGANRKQGWCLFGFLIGFTFVPAGLAGLGVIFVLIGLACLIGSLAGFIQIKGLEHGSAGNGDNSEGVAAASQPSR